MMMEFQTAEHMMNGNFGMMLVGMWFTWIIFITLGILGILALLKYLGK